MRLIVKTPTGNELTRKNRLSIVPGLKTPSGVRLITLLLMLLFLSVLSNVKAQVTEEDATPIKVNTLLFTIPLTVSDKNGRNFAGLKKENFTIYQDDEEQPIELFLNEEAPMNVAILLDTSYSTREVLDDIQDAARDFLKLLRPGDKALIVGFAGQTVFYSGLSSDRKELSRAIEQARISTVDGSEMYNAISQVVQAHFAKLKGRKAIIALTDGIVYGRGVSAQQVMDMMQDADTLFYPIIFKTDALKKTKNRKPATVELLQILAEETAGSIYEKETDKLKEAFRSIAEDLKKQYLLGFYPYDYGKGKSPGHIRVEVDRKELIVRAKKKLKFE